MNTTMSRLTSVGLGAMLLIVGSTATTAVALPWPRTADFDLTSSAQPTAAGTYVGDDAFDTASSARQRVRADATATTSATCDGCSGEATTLQVLYLKRPRSTHVDNNAVAWTTCTSCGSLALSVQVVVISGTTSVTANNRALAVNALCEVCATASAAFQVVVVAPDAERLSAEAMDDLRTWFSAQLEILRATAVLPTKPPPPPPTASPDGSTGPGEPGRRSALPEQAAADAQTDLAALATLVNADLGSRTDEAHAEVDVPPANGS